jgi:hypothetical protein
MTSVYLSGMSGSARGEAWTPSLDVACPPAHAPLGQATGLGKTSVGHFLIDGGFAKAGQLFNLGTTNNKINGLGIHLSFSFCGKTRNRAVHDKLSTFSPDGYSKTSKVAQKRSNPSRKFRNYRKRSNPSKTANQAKFLRKLSKSIHIRIMFL